MQKTELRLSIILIVAFAIISQAIWLIEIARKIGWAGTSWLKQDLYTPFIICLFVALAYIAPFWASYRKIDTRLVLTTLTFYMLNLSCYLLSDVVFKGLHNNPTALLQILRISLFFIFTGGYYYVTNELIMPLKKEYSLVFLLCIALMFGLGFVTVFFIRGWGTGYGLVDAVKMGYPQFWICILLGLSGMFFISKNNE
jgi:hypothetical protein